MVFKSKKLASNIVLVLFCICSNFIISQEPKGGMALYGVKSFYDFDNDSIQKRSKVLIKANNSLSSLKFVLKFNSFESLFEHQKGLNSDEESQVVINLALNLVGKGEYYTNIKNQEKVLAKELLGDNFLIKSPWDDEKWTISTESKTISGFKCFKATKTLAKNIIRIREKKITAWFSPEIAFPYGPKNFGGLPGLILELNEDKLIFFLKELDFSNQPQIQKPNKGLELTEEKFNNYVIEKSKEFGFIKD